MVPHMLHTENSTQVDIILDGIQTNGKFSKSRFAIELLVVGSGDPEIPMFVDPKKSLDDEHTPGIFEVIRWMGGDPVDESMFYSFFVKGFSMSLRTLADSINFSVPTLP